MINFNFTLEYKRKVHGFVETFTAMPHYRKYVSGTCWSSYTDQNRYLSFLIVLDLLEDDEV